MLPEFLEFAAGAVLVAHNASFDVGFVDAELSRLQGRRLAAPVLDTVMLARRLLPGPAAADEPGHPGGAFRHRRCARATGRCPDAEATAEVLAALLGLAQERGVRTVADAISLAGPARRPVSRRREMARDVPTGPGVYLFRDATGRVLYVGKATDLRARVRSYFTGSAQRRAIEHALSATERVETRPLGSELEAALVELELIARLRPAANSRNAHPERACYLTLSHADPVPRLSITAKPQPGAADAGPAAQPRRGAARQSLPCARPSGIRSCRPALPDDETGCLAGVLGTCHAPCRGRRRGDRPRPAPPAACAGGSRPAATATSCALSGSGWPRSPPTSATRTRPPFATGWTRSTASAAAPPGCDARPAAAACCSPPTSTTGSCRRSPAPAAAWSARRRLPRAGDALLEIAPLLLSMDTATGGRPVPFGPEEAEAARIVSAAFARPGVALRAISSTGGPGLASAVSRLRGAVALRR